MNTKTLTPSSGAAAIIDGASNPSKTLAREYASCVTGIAADQLTVYSLHPGRIIYRFKDATDYEYAKSYAELTQLGPPTENDERGGKHWDLGDKRRVIIWRSAPTTFLIALVDAQPKTPDDKG